MISPAHSKVVFVLSGQQEFPLASLLAATAPVGKRTLEFFTTQLSNDHTRKAYLTVLKTFSAWCETKGVSELGQVEPVHVAAYLKELGQHRSAPTVKQHLSG